MDSAIAWLQQYWFFLSIIISAVGLILRVDRRVQKLFHTVEMQDEKQLAGVERTELLIQALYATLDALQEQGHNGEVKAARSALDHYLQKQAAK